MVSGKLEPTLEEQLAKSGKGTINVTLWHIQHGTVGEGKDAREFSVDANPKTIVVQIGKREVLYSIHDLVSESAEIIDKAEISERIDKKIAEQKTEREKQRELDVQTAKDFKDSQREL